MAIIFLHGFPFNKSCWDEQVNYFKPNYSVHAMDLRGHGKAPTPPGPWMIAHFAEDLKSYMDSHKIDQAIICGLSMGGYIAMQFAITHPERTAGLILCDTRADADSNEAKDKRFATLQSLRSEGLAAFAKSFSAAVLGEKSIAEKPELQKKLENIILENKIENVAMTIGALSSRRDSFPYLSQVLCQTLVLAGSEDRVTPAEVNELMSRKIPNSQFFKIEGAGHMSNMEQPLTFNQYVMQFLLQFKDLK